MPALGAFCFGTLGGLGLVLLAAGWAARWFRGSPQRAFAFLAAVLRAVSERSGYRSVLLERDGETLVVPFEQLALAMENRALLAHEPVRVTRSDRPPPLPPRPRREAPPDGHA